MKDEVEEADPRFAKDISDKKIAEKVMPSNVDEEELENIIFANPYELSQIIEPEDLDEEEQVYQGTYASVSSVEPFEKSPVLPIVTESFKLDDNAISRPNKTGEQKEDDRNDSDASLNYSEDSKTKPLVFAEKPNEAQQPVQETKNRKKETTEAIIRNADFSNETSHVVLSIISDSDSNDLENNIYHTEATVVQRTVKPDIEISQEILTSGGDISLQISNDQTNTEKDSKAGPDEIKISIHSGHTKQKENFEVIEEAVDFSDNDDFKTANLSITIFSLEDHRALENQDASNTSSKEIETPVSLSEFENFTEDINSFVKISKADNKIIISASDEHTEDTEELGHETEIPELVPITSLNQLAKAIEFISTLESSFNPSGNFQPEHGKDGSETERAEIKILVSDEILELTEIIREELRSTLEEEDSESMEESTDRKIIIFSKKGEDEKETTVYKKDLQIVKEILLLFDKNFNEPEDAEVREADGSQNDDIELFIESAEEMLDENSVSEPTLYVSEKILNFIENLMEIIPEDKSSEENGLQEKDENKKINSKQIVFLVSSEKEVKINKTKLKKYLKLVKQIKKIKNSESSKQDLQAQEEIKRNLKLSQNGIGSLSWLDSQILFLLLSFMIKIHDYSSYKQSFYHQQILQAQI